MTEKRDLQKDLEICEAATPGPWAADTDCTIEQNWLIRCTTGYKHFIAFMRNCVCKDSQNNATFIAESREGWPHAITRALEAEKRIAELEAERRYLLLRSMEAGACNLGDAERAVGRSSNAMVYHAFGGPPPTDKWNYPLDPSDLAACYRARNSAPRHLWPKMDALLREYEAEVCKQYPDAVERATRWTGGLKRGEQ